MERSEQQQMSVDALRTFVMQSPPGQLQDTLRSLHTLCAGSELFFDHVEELALEYTLRHQRAFTVESDPSSPNPQEKMFVLCSKQNHFVSLVKAIARQLKVPGDDVAAEFLAYFDEGEPFKQLNCVFLEFSAELFAEIDPVEGKVVSTRPFPDASRSSQMMNMLLRPEASHGAVVSKFIRTLRKEAAKYIATSFASSSSSHNNLASKGKRRSEQTAASSLVSVSPDGRSVMIALTCERYAPSSGWAGRWKSLHGLQHDGSAWNLRSEARIDGHYFEDANVHVNLEERTDESTQERFETEDNFFEDTERERLSGRSTEASGLAKAVVAHVRQWELDLQAKLERRGKVLAETSLKALRRRLPVSKQLFDFQRALMSIQQPDDDDDESLTK